MMKLKQEFDKQKLEYTFLSTETELIPKRIFYQWAVNNPDYLASKVLINSTYPTKVDLSFA